MQSCVWGCDCVSLTNTGTGSYSESNNVSIANNAACKKTAEKVYNKCKHVTCNQKIKIELYKQYKQWSLLFFSTLELAVSKMVSTISISAPPSSRPRAWSAYDFTSSSNAAKHSILGRITKIEAAFTDIAIVWSLHRWWYWQCAVGRTHCTNNIPWYTWTMVHTVTTDM